MPNGFWEKDAKAVSTVSSQKQDFWGPDTQPITPPARQDIWESDAKPTSDPLNEAGISLPGQQDFSKAKIDIVPPKDKEPIGFFEAIRRQDKTEMIPFNPESAIKAGKTLYSTRRIQSGEADQSDIDRVNEYLQGIEDDNRYNIRGKIAKGAMALPAFIIEFIMTGGLATLGKKAVKEGIKGGIRSLVKSGAKKTAARVAGGLAGAGLRTAAMPHRVAKSFADRQLRSSLKLTEKGLEIADESSEKPHISTLKAFGDVFIENFSEVLGPTLSKAGKQIGEKIIPRAISEGMEKVFKKMHPSKAVKSLWTKAGYHGFLEEMGEERVGAFLRAVTGVEDFGAKDPDSMMDRILSSIPNWEELLVEAGVLAFPGGVSLATHQAFSLRERKDGPPELKPLADEKIEEIAKTTRKEETQKKASLAEIERAEAAGETSPGTATLAKYLIEEVDPNFDADSALEISAEVNLASPEILKAEGIPESEAGDYAITGKTVSRYQKDGVRTAVSLFKGHDADTLVEEWYHRAFDRMSGKARAAFEKYHRDSGDTRPINEHFAQEGRDYFFSQKLHEKAGGIRGLFDQARESLKIMIGRIRALRERIAGGEVPRKVKRLYKQIGKSMSAQEPTNTTQAYDQFSRGIEKSYGKKVSHQLKKTMNPIFFSFAESQIQQKMPSSAPADQVRGILKSSGVKQEELDLLDIESFLKDKKTVTKEELLDYIQANQIEVNTVVKGEASKVYWSFDELPYHVRKEVKEESDERGLSHRSILEYMGYIVRLDDGGEISKIESPAPASHPMEEDVKFSKWQLPGGKNYREVLLTLPSGFDKPSQRMTEIEGILTPENKLSESEQKALREEYEKLSKFERDDKPFKSPHFDEPNILAHIRMNDRTDSEGRKILFIEEIQSDWHQQGREEGDRSEFAEENKKVKEAEILYEKLYDKMYGANGLHTAKFETDGHVWKFDASGPLLKEGNSFKSIDENQEPFASIYKKIVASDQYKSALELAEAFEKAQRIGRHAVTDKGLPDAPFKKTWHGLALKRILRMAAEEGYDAIAWTTGEMQADRYDLSKHVDKVEWHPKDQSLRAYKGKEKLINESGVTEEKLADHIGKDAAKKLTETEPEILGHHVLKGQDLKVGGEGMKAFYDKMIPQFLNKYTKKWGARVKQVEIKAEEDIMAGEEADVTKVHALDITPSMEKSVLDEGQRSFQIRKIEKPTEKKVSEPPYIPEGVRPTEEPKKEPVPRTRQETVAPRPVLARGEGRESRAFKRIKGRYEDELKDIKATYTPITLAEDTAKAVRFVEEQPVSAARVARGIEAPPSGVTETAISIAYSEKMRETGNWGEVAKTEKSRSLRQTRRGQEIAAERGRVNDNAPDHFIQIVIKQRLMQAGKKLFPGIKKLGRSENKSQTARATERIRHEADSIKTKLSQDRIKIMDAQKIIDSLVC